MRYAVIPARGGSTRIHMKNIREFHGHPLIAYSILAAKESNLFKKIIVSTDDKKIMEACAKYGITEFHYRSEELSRDEVGTYEVVADVVEAYDLDEMDDICCIYATNPMISADDLVIAWSDLEEADHVISVGYPPLQDASHFYWSSIAAIKAGVGYWEDCTKPYLIDSGRVCDINTMIDFKRAERMYEEYLK